MESAALPESNGPAPVAASPDAAACRPTGGPSLALLLVLAAGFLPLLMAFLAGLWSKPAYRFFPAGLVAAGALLWLRARREPAERQPGPAWLTVALMSLALIALGAATLFWSPWVGAVAALVALLATANWVGGLALLTAWLPGWLVLLTLLPAPLGLDERLLTKLRSGLVTLARPLLGQYDVLHVVRASTIELPAREVPIADACIGLYLIPAAMALALVLTTLFRRSWVHSLIVALSMPVWTFLGALAWLLVGLKLAASGGVGLFSGLLGAGALVVFLVALTAMALSMDQFVWFWAAPSRGSTAARPASNPARPAPRAVTSSRLGWAVAGVFALLGLAQAGLAMRGFFNEPPAAVVVAPLTARTVLTLPPEIAGWRQFTNHFSAMDDLITPTPGAQTWHFARGELGASITLEQPLTGYQNLVANYLNSGWRVLRLAEATGGNPQSAPFVTAELQKEIFQFGRLWFAVGDMQGRWLPPPRPAGRAERFGAPPPAPAQPTFRLQVFVGSLEPLTPAEVESAENFFQIVRQQLAAQLTGQPLPPNAPAQSQ